MYCKYCGNEIKAGMKFCTSCGKPMLSEQGDINDTKKSSEEKNKGILVILVFVLIFLAGGMILFTTRKTLDDKTIQALLNEDKDWNININGTNISVTLQKTDILSKDKRGQGNGYEVIANTLSSNGQIEADVQYSFLINKKDEKWVIADKKVIQVMDIRPLHGVVEPYEEDIKQAIKELYPQIDWTFNKSSFVLKNFDYNFPISWELQEQETDLEDRTDCLLYSYKINTFSGDISGQLRIDYNFVDGQWEQSNITQISSDFEWNLIGLWEFDIFTYYVSVYFEDVDFETHIATLLCKGGYIHGDDHSGHYEEFKINFEENEDGLYFDPFNVSDTFGKGTTEIHLVATMEDLRYWRPAMFANMDDVLDGAGGKIDDNGANTEYSLTKVQKTIKQGDLVEGTIKKSSLNSNEFLLVFDQKVNFEVWDEVAGKTKVTQDVDAVEVYSSLVANMGVKDLTPYESKRVTCYLDVSEYNGQIDAEMTGLEFADGEERWQLSESEIEEEVLRIRQVWTTDQNAASAGQFDIYTDDKGIKYYKKNGDTKLVVVPQGVFGDYNITFQIENGDVTFAYYVNDKEQNRFYFKYQMLFRWNETKSGEEAVIHNNEFESQQFKDWEGEVLADYILLDIY